MNKIPHTLLAAASASLVLATLGQAQPSPIRSAMSGSDVDAISRVTNESVKNRLTATDLIGTSVYDPTGEKIGDITDIDLQGSLPSTLVSSFHAEHKADSPTADIARVGNSRIGDARADNGRADSGHADRDERPSQARDGSLSSTLTARAVVFISVGGLWGIGDDLVAVPASKIRFNPAEDRFELAVPKSEVVALAEGKSSREYNTDANATSSAAGRQNLAAEAERVNKALASDPQTSAFAHKVRVNASNDTLLIHGEVDNNEQRKRIQEAARRATALKIDDKISVR